MPPTGDYGGMYLFKLCTIHMIIPDFSSTCASDGKEQRTLSRKGRAWNLVEGACL